MTRGLIGLMLGLVVAAHAAADDPVTVKVREARPGDKVKVTKTRNSETKIHVTIGGMTNDQTDTKAVKQVYVEEVLERAAGAKKATKLRRTYESFDETAKGKTTQPVFVGKTVLIQKAGDKYTYTIEGGAAVTGKDAAVLDREFNRKGGDGLNTHDALPKTPVKAGDTWALDKDVLHKAFSGSGIELDPAGTKGTGRLAKVYEKDGKKFGVIELSLHLPVKAFGGKSPIALAGGSALTITGTLDCCIDGTDPSETGAGKVLTKLKGSGDGTELDITGTETFTDKTELLTK